MLKHFGNTNNRLLSVFVYETSQIYDYLVPELEKTKQETKWD